MTDDFTGMPKPMPRPDLPAPSEVADDLSDAERIGVAVAAMVSGITEARDQAQDDLAEAEATLAEAVTLLDALAAVMATTTTFAHDTEALDRATQFLERMEGLGSPETPDETKDGH